MPVPVGKEAGDQVYYRASDAEMRYRQRYLHWLLEPQARQRIRQRAQIVACIRAYLAAADFLEVDTPTIAPTAGGALARPFATSIWALDHQEAFLRIAPELHLKQYLVGGFERVFTLCQNFRNEGIDRSHNPEFTMVEWYEAHTEYRRQMERFEELVAAVCRAVCGSTRVVYQGRALDFAPPWPRLTLLEALARYGGVEAEGQGAGALRAELAHRGLPLQPDWSWGEAVGELFEALCVDQLGQPVFIVDHPLDLSPWPAAMPMTSAWWSALRSTSPAWSWAMPIQSSTTRWSNSGVWPGSGGNTATGWRPPMPNSSGLWVAACPCRRGRTGSRPPGHVAE